MSAAGAPKIVTNRVSGAGQNMTAEIATDDGKTVITDEPISFGGDDLGTTPMHLLLCSLVGCNQATATQVNRRMKLPIERITYEVEGSFDARGFLGVPGVDPEYSDVKVVADVHPSEGGAISADELEALGAAVQARCPVEALFNKAGTKMDVTWRLAAA
eukprot:g2227.t1